MAELAMLFAIFLCLISLSLGIDPPVFMFYLFCITMPPMLLFIWWSDRWTKKWVERERNKSIEELRKQYPGIKSFDEFMAELEEKTKNEQK